MHITFISTVPVSVRVSTSFNFIWESQWFQVKIGPHYLHRTSICVFPSDLFTVRHPKILHSHFRMTEYFKSSDNMLPFSPEDTLKSQLQHVPAASMLVISTSRETHSIIMEKQSYNYFSSSNLQFTSHNHRSTQSNQCNRESSIKQPPNQSPLPIMSIIFHQANSLTDGI
jgi:hypothetical protein